MVQAWGSRVEGSKNKIVGSTSRFDVFALSGCTLNHKF